MILEIDTSILDRIPTLSINQLVFLTLVLNDIKTINQDIQRLLSLVNEEEIQELETQGLISIQYDRDTQVISKTEKLEELLKEEIKEVKIFNILGQNIKTWNNDAIETDATRISLPTKTFAKGIYIVNITTSEGKYSKKIIIE
mgnify:CR=1 FL=1